MFKKKKREDVLQAIHHARVYGTGADWNSGRWYAFVDVLGGLLPFTYPSRSDLDQNVRALLRDYDDDPWGGGLVRYTPALASEVVAAGIEL